MTDCNLCVHKTVCDLWRSNECQDASCFGNGGECDFFLEERRWIPVTERLPEKDIEVVGWYKDNPFSPFRYGIVSWNGHGWVFTYAQRYVDDVTHWMPLPEPPKEDA